MGSEERQILAAKQAAKYLGISLATLRNIENSGALVPSRTPGGHRRCRFAMLDEYFEESRRNANGTEEPRSEDASYSGTPERRP